jgi:uncharacterized protein YdaU (DUF1376 family)
MRKPWWPFYVDDFENSGRVKLMTNAEKGCYVTLLSYQWREGFVPSEVVDLARICGEPPAVFKKYWKRLEHHFPVCKDGKRRNDRIETERLKADLVSERQRVNVTKRHSHGTATAGERQGSGTEVVGERYGSGTEVVRKWYGSGTEVVAPPVIYTSHKSQVTDHRSQNSIPGNPVISSPEQRTPTRIDASDTSRFTA